MRRSHSTALSPTVDLLSCRSEIESEHAANIQNGTIHHNHAARPSFLRRASKESSYAEPAAPWYWLDCELSSNVAGETGAVYIYEGAKAALSLRGASESTLSFVREHREAEARHLAIFSALLPPSKQTRLLPVWRVAGWVLGFVPALLSDRALFLTVEAVETFVEVHYVRARPSRGLRARGRVRAPQAARHLLRLRRPL